MLARPEGNAADYRQGTIVKSGDWFWESYWDTQDHRLEWRTIENKEKN